jgi:hypothetical protein
MAPAMGESMGNILGSNPGNGTQREIAPAGGGNKLPDMSGDIGMNTQMAQADSTNVQAARQSGGESPQSKNLITSLADARNEMQKMRSDYRDGMRQKIYSYLAGGLNNG